MDMKYKKQILLVIKMNNAHQFQLKISPKNTVNLEMFCKVCIYTNFGNLIIIRLFIVKVKNKYLNLFLCKLYLY